MLSRLTYNILNWFCLGEVGKLEAIDYDTEENGPPFTFRIDPKVLIQFVNYDSYMY